MKNQVTSIEQSRRLLELGVPAEKASMIYQSHFTQGESKLYAQPYQVNGYPPKEKIREDVVPAFTVADLLEMLPEFIDKNKSLFIECRLVCDSGSKWCIGYRDRVTLWIDSESSLVDVCILGIEWLLSNDYKLES